MDDLTEEQARQMEAGPKLNRICAEWMGWSYFAGMGSHQWKLEASGSTRPIIHQGKDPPPFSTDWSAAGPLLEAMEAKHGGVHPPSCEIECRSYKRSEWYTKEEWRQQKWRCLVLIPEHEDRQLFGLAPTPQLAIARACAVLVARGISRDELKN